MVESQWAFFYFLFGLFLTVNLERVNLCSNATGCSCSRVETQGGIRAVCLGYDPDLFHLHKDVRTLVIREANFSEMSLLSNIRTIASLEKFYLRNTEVIYFDWNWLPDSCSTATFRQTHITGNFNQILFQDQFGNCNLRPTLNVSKIYIFDTLYQDVPSCLPDSLSTVSFVRSPLRELGSNSTKPVRWPLNLRLLNIKWFEFTNIAPRMFQNISNKHIAVYIGNCETPISIFPTNWPRNSAIESLYFKSCQLSTMTSSAFEFLQNLLILDLTKNNLTEISPNLPASLQTLVLSDNFISYVSPDTWFRLTNLTTLTINSNQLRLLPLNLPASLIFLRLRENMIEYLDGKILQHLKMLHTLDLSGNKLIIMPINLPSSLEVYDLSNNPISSVQSTSNYEFCYNCSINVRGIRWVCDYKFVEMLYWMHTSPAMLLVDSESTCGSSIDTGLKENQFRKILNYFEYISRSEEFRACTYNITEMICNSASINTLPRNPPASTSKTVITNNPNLTLIPRNYFAKQTKLLQLNLNRNALKAFPIGLPSSLMRLWLNENQIKVIGSEAQATLNNLTQLVELHLRFNQIRVLYDYQLRGMVNLEWIGLDQNPLHCDCSIFSLMLWYEEKAMKDSNTNRISKLFLPTCQTPDSRNGTSLTSQYGYFSYTLLCLPEECEWVRTATLGILNCSRSTQIKLSADNPYISDSPDLTVQPYIPSNSYWEVLDLSHLQLNQSAIHLQQLSRLQTLNLSDNLLSAIPSQELPPSLRTLILSNNFIQGLPPKLNVDFPQLELLDLTNNSIKVLLNKDLVYLPLIQMVLLKENPFECNCSLRPFINYIQAQREHQDALINNEFKVLTCRYPKNLRGFALFEIAEENYCSVAIWNKITGGIVGGITFLLIISMVVIAVLYKRRKLQERKDILKAFKQLLEKETFVNPENPDQLNREPYQYDAFISYCSSQSDEDFVYKMLEVLEDQKGRKLCIHERDFMPGKGIADNIVNSISMSRRIVLVITKKYIASAWCQYEVQVALAQMHQHRRGKFLIPILLEDVIKDDQCAGSIKTILSLISGIHVPSSNKPNESWNKFWNTIEKTIIEQSLHTIT